MARPLNDDERRLLQQLAEKLPSNIREQVLKDVSNLEVQEEANDGSRLMFSIEGYARPAYSGQRSFPVEARILDSDGTELTVVLYGDENGRLLELEYLRWGGGNVGKPQIDSLQVW